MKYLPFLQSQKLLSIATQERGKPWIATVYFGVDEKGILYFVSQKDAKHSVHITKNSAVAFSVAWCDPKNPNNRKGVQGIGTCTLARGPKQILTALSAIHKKIPEFKKTITLEWVRKNAWGSKIWVIKPSYIKYWDDELYGDEESEEFHL